MENLSYIPNEIITRFHKEFLNLKKLQNGSGQVIEYKNKFAELVNVDYDLLKIAKQYSIGENIAYSVKLVSKEALNISLQFGEFKLSTNSLFSISTDYELDDSITGKEDNSKIYGQREFIKETS